MLRLSLLVFASAFAFITHVQALDAPAANQPAMDASLELNDELIEFSELEYQLIKTSGLLSLSQQVKYSAQSIIADSIAKPSSSEAAGSQVMINQAQHFAIAKQLAKRWTEDQWQQRLLVLIDEMPVPLQKLIQQQLAQPRVQAAQRKESAAISVQGDPAYRLYINKLRQNPPAVSRWQLVEDLDQQSGFSAIIIQARLAVIKEIKQQVPNWQAEERWQQQVRQDVLEFLFYAYRKTPNAELKSITDSFNQPELKQFYRDVLNTIH